MPTLRAEPGAPPCRSKLYLRVQKHAPSGFHGPFGGPGPAPPTDCANL